MCEYCCGYEEVELKGDDGVVIKDGITYIFAEHFRGEIVKIPVNYCPKCGEDLRLRPVKE